MSAAAADNRPTDVSGRVKMLCDKQLKESLQKVFATAVAAVNNQGGRDNGAADTSGDSSSTGANEFSNVALGQSVEECMVGRVIIFCVSTADNLS